MRLFRGELLRLCTLFRCLRRCDIDLCALLRLLRGQTFRLGAFFRCLHQRLFGRKARLCLRRAARFDFRTCARSFLRLSFYRYPGLRQFACFALSCRQRKGAGLGDTLGRELRLSNRLRLLFRTEALCRGLIRARRFFGTPRYRVQQCLIQIQALPKDRLCVTLGFAALPRLRLGSLFFPYALARLDRSLRLLL